MDDRECAWCGLRSLATDDKCAACGAALSPGAQVRPRTTFAAPHAQPKPSVHLSTDEPLAPPGRLFGIVRVYLGVLSALFLAVWAYGMLLVIVMPWLFYAALLSFPFIVYQLVTFYCCLKVLPARRIAALGLGAHLAVTLYGALFSELTGAAQAGGGASSSGWVVTLTFLVSWGLLHAGRRMDEGRLRVGTETQTALGVALVLVSLVAFGLAYAHDIGEATQFERF